MEMPSETPNRDAVRIDLSGDWLLAAADNSHALTIALPGDVHSALQRAGIIADPYRGRTRPMSSGSPGKTGCSSAPSSSMPTI